MESRKIESLQAFRALAALSVFLIHYFSTQFDMAVDQLQMGVSYFFVLSGFVLCRTYEASIPAQGGFGRQLRPIPFMLRRIRRIYPLHVLCWLYLIIIIIIYGGRPEFSYFANLFLIQSWFPQESVFYSLNSPSWCLADFLFLYLIFPYMLATAVRRRRLFATLTISLSLLWAIAVAWIPDSRVLWGIYVMPLPRVLDFAIGMLLWQAVSRLSERFAKKAPARRRANLIQAGAVGVIVAACFVAPYVPMRWNMTILWWIPTALLIGAFTLTDREGVLGKLFQARWLVALGNVSFEFYMIHMTVLHTTANLLLHFTPIASTSALYYTAVGLAALSLTTAGAFLTRRYIEKPIDGLLQRLKP